MNYFKLFDLPELFKINIKTLVLKFYKLQKKYHPDINHDFSKIKKNDFLNMSININKGYSILKSSVKRAKHLLYLNLYDFEKEKHNICKKNFLHKQLELYEKLEMLKNSPDKNLEIHHFFKKLKSKRKHHLSHLELMLNIQEWNLAAIELYKFSFYKKIIKVIKKLEIYKN
ncbi:MAG: Fe-S protein assembly co-chaperone HscB [Buchnera aphidicola (Nurudea shiraii)]